MTLAVTARNWSDSLFRHSEILPALGPVLLGLYRVAAGTATTLLEARLPVRLHSGRIDSGEELSFLSVGASHWSDLLVRKCGFSRPGSDRPDLGRVENLGSVPALTLPSFLDRWESRVDIISVRAGGLLTSRLTSRCLTIPEWVNWGYSLPLADPAAAEESRDSADASLQKCLRRSIQHSITCVRKGRTSSRVSTDLCDLEFFYHRMYRPTALTRHGPTAKVFPLGNLVPRLRYGGLLILSLDGEEVGSILYERRPNELKACYIGVLDARRDLYELHIPACLYYHLIRLAHSHGYRAINFGGSHPLLTDGPTAHKLLWGMRPRPKPDSHYYFSLRINRDTPATRRFLALNPLLASSRGRLWVLACRVADVDEAKVAVRRAASVGGVGERVLLDCGEPETRTPGFTHRLDASSGLPAAVDQARRLMQQNRPTDSHQASSPMTSDR